MLGFAISAIVQAWAPRERIEAALDGSGLRPLALATGPGAASSSCSYAAIVIAKSLFQKAASALAFQFASPSLVAELGVVIWALIGWQSTLAEFVGGIVLIAIVSTAGTASRPPTAAGRASRRGSAPDEPLRAHGARADQRAPLSAW